MKIAYLVDTNIVSELVRPRPDVTVKQRWQTHYHELALSSVSWHEILHGIARLQESKRKRALTQFVDQMIAPLPILPYEADAAAWFADERARLEAKGEKPSYPDGQIAAVAGVNNLIMVTRNESDFARFNGLTIENWFDP